MEKFAAVATCNTCLALVEEVGRSPRDAETLLRRRHGLQHIFQGHIQSVIVDAETARRIERRRVP